MKRRSASYSKPFVVVQADSKKLEAGSRSSIEVDLEVDPEVDPEVVEDIVTTNSTELKF